MDNKKIKRLLAELRNEGINLANYERDNYVPAELGRYGQSINAGDAIRETGVLGRSLYQFPFVAQFDITVKRLTATITQDLDYVLFGSRDADANFANVVQLGTGTSINVKYGQNVNEPARMVMTYTNGANTDIVEVRCSQYPYPSLLSASLVDRLELSGIRYSISDTTLTDQFSKKLQTYSRSMFGKNMFNSLSAASMKNPEQFQAGIIDIPLKWQTDSESGIVGTIRQTAEFSLTFSLFVENYKKLQY